MKISGDFSIDNSELIELKKDLNKYGKKDRDWETLLQLR